MDDLNKWIRWTKPVGGRTDANLNVHLRTIREGDFSSVETVADRLGKAIDAIWKTRAPQSTQLSQSRGNKKGSKKSSNRKTYSDDDKKLKERWQKAKEAGVLKRKFCDDENITRKELGAAIDRSDYHSGDYRKKI